MKYHNYKIIVMRGSFSAEEEELMKKIEDSPDAEVFTNVYYGQSFMLAMVRGKECVIRSGYEDGQPADPFGYLIWIDLILGSLLTQIGNETAKANPVIKGYLEGIYTYLEVALRRQFKKKNGDGDPEDYGMSRS